MRFRNTLILLVLLAGLGAYVWFVEYPEAQKEAEKKTLLTFKPDEVTELSLTYPDRDIVLKKSGDDWKLTKPIEAEADQTAVKGLLNTISQGEVKKTLENAPADLSPFGLDHPAATIAITVGDKALPQIKVGKDAPVGSTAYVQRGDEKQVLLTPSFFRTSVDKKVKDLRDKTILRVAEEDVHKIALQGSGTDIVLAKKDGHWSIEKPGMYRADDAVVRSLLSAMRSLRAVDFPDEKGDLSTYGLDAPRLTVAVWTGANEEKSELLIGKESDEKQVYVKTGSRPVIYAVGDWTYQDLNKSLDDLRDKTLLAFDTEKVASIEVKHADGRQLKLVRGGDKTWSVADTEGKAAEGKITQFLKDVHELKGYEIAADGVTALQELGLEPPDLSITVTGEGDAPLGTILLGQREKDGKKEYTGAKAGGTTVFVVRDFLYTRVDKPARDFIEQPTPTIAPVTPGAAPPAAAAAGDEDEEDGDWGEEED